LHPADATREDGSKGIGMTKATDEARRTLLKAGLGAAGAAALAQPACAEIRGASAIRRLRASPWGLANSHSSAIEMPAWIAEAAKSKVRHIRGFDRTPGARGLEMALREDMAVSGILMQSRSDPETFPVTDPAGWIRHVHDLVERHKGQVIDWEVWNEPPNFSASQKPEDYAAIVLTAHTVGKAVDPDARFGLCAQSVHVEWLRQVIENGAADRYDFITVHPYEILDLVQTRGFETQFMAIVPTLRKMLAATNPARADVPVLFTELGQPVGGEWAVSEDVQAATLVKAFVMAAAQGAERVCWFEVLDGDSGDFGVIAPDGRRRPSFFALQTIVDVLGEAPRYLGWVKLLDGAHGFAFRGPRGPVIAAWTPPDGRIALPASRGMAAIDPRTGQEVDAGALTDQPLFLLSPPAEWLRAAEANRNRRYDWDGDYSGAAEVSFGVDGSAGLLAADAPAPTGAGPDRAIDASGSGQQRFAVDPGFLSWDTTPITVAVEARRTSEAQAGFNLFYEAVGGERAHDSGWWEPPADGGWHVREYPIADARFVSKWGCNLILQSDGPQLAGYQLRRVSVRRG
jgi:hypothetical protein